MKKTIVSLLMALALVLCLSALAAPEAQAADDSPIQFHCKCGNKHSTALEDGEITWKEGTTQCYASCDGVILQWTAYDLVNGSSQPGNYYLPDNGAADGIAIRSNTFVFGSADFSGEFNLDMNGNDLNMNGKSVKAMTVHYGSSLNLCNSKTTGGNITALGKPGEHSGVLTVSNTSAASTAVSYGVNLKRLEGNTLLNGGAVRVASGCSFTAYDCEIVGGAVTQWGGTMDIQENATVTLTNVNISGGNAVSNGGNIYNAGTLTMTGGSITGGVCTSDAGRGGGNLYNLATGTATLNGVTVSGGTVTGFGGNITTYGALTMTNCTVSGGISADHGGSIYADGSKATVTVTGGSITEGQCTGASKYGGNIFISGTVPSLQMTGVTVADGTSASNAGNIYINHNSIGDIDFTNCTIYGGVAGGDGGNLWIGTKSDNAPEAAANVVFSECIIYGGTAQKGGSMVIARRVALNYSTVGTDAIVGPNVDPTSGLGGHATVNGGNVFINNCELVMNGNSTIVYGVADGNGGNVFLGGGENAKLTMYNSSALRFGSSKSPKATSSTVTGGGNAFIDKGGKIYMYSTSKIDGGDALWCGGNVCINNGYLQLGGTSFIAGGGYNGTYNTASMVPITARGGNVYIAADGFLQMVGNSQIRNGACTNESAQGANILSSGRIIIAENAQVYGGMYGASKTNRNIHQFSGSLVISDQAKIDGGCVIQGGTVRPTGKPTIAHYIEDKDGNVKTGRTLYLAEGVTIDASGLWNGANIQIHDLAPTECEGRLLATIGEGQDSDVKTRIQFTADSTQLAGYVITRERDADGVLGLYLRKSTAAGVREPGIPNSVLDYVTWEDAYEAVTEDGNIVLNQDIDGVTIDKNLVIDLNGYNMTNVTLAEGVTLYGADTATHDYKVETGFGTLTLAEGSLGTVAELTDATEAQMGAERTYMTIVEDGTYSFHRYRTDVVKISLRTGNRGFGYKFRFSGDEMVQAKLSGFGIRLWLDGAEHTVTRTLTMDKFDSTKEFSLRLTDFDIALFGDVDVYAQAFLKLKDGGELTGETVNYSMMTMLQKVNAALADFSETQILAIQEMLTEEEKAVVSTWGVDDLLNWVPATDEDETPEAPIV